MEAIVLPKDGDSPLLESLKAHIREEVLLVVTLLAVISKCKKIVKFSKKSRMGAPLEKDWGALLQEVDTR